MDSKRKGGNDFYFLFGQITGSRGNEDDEKWAKSTSRVINVAISVLRCRVWNITSHGRVALRAHGSVTFPLSYETRKWPRIPPPLLATTMPPPSLLSGGVVKSDTIRSFFTKKSDDEGCAMLCSTFVEYSYVLDDSKILFLLNISRVICIKKELSLFFSSYILFFFFLIRSAIFTIRFGFNLTLIHCSFKKFIDILFHSCREWNAKNEYPIKLLPHNEAQAQDMIAKFELIVENTIRYTGLTEFRNDTYNYSQSIKYFLSSRITKHFTTS